MGDGEEGGGGEGGGGPEVSAGITGPGGQRVGVSVGKEGVQGYGQQRIAPYVYGAKTKVGKDGVTVTPGITVETPGYGPAGIHGIGEVDGDGNLRVGAGVSAGIPKVGEIGAEGTVPIDLSQAALVRSSAIAAGYQYDNTPISEQDPKVLYQADQLDGGHRLQDYNDQMYGSPMDTPPGVTPPKQEHVKHCPTCPPWPNIPKKRPPMKPSSPPDPAAMDRAGKQLGDSFGTGP